ncbi:MAG: DUF2760 domain-containing protein [Pirellulaceae bacterium]|jgi:hypothetical protein|nr:DUF2760 domain-containing protein [Pirellulaceae bacterium]
MRIWLAIRLFCKVLFDGHFARRVREQVDPPRAGVAGAVPEPAGRTREAAEGGQTARTARGAARSEAISLLAALQREARLVDLVKEPLGNYSDAQVGAAARDVLRDCGRVLDRFFDLQPLVDQEEGSVVDIPAEYDTGRYRLTGHVGSEPPRRGRLVHHGWVATRCEVPTWTGSAAARLVVAPEEVELPPPPNAEGSPL